MLVKHWQALKHRQALARGPSALGMQGLAPDNHLNSRDTFRCTQYIASCLSCYRIVQAQSTMASPRRGPAFAAIYLVAATFRIIVDFLYNPGRFLPQNLALWNAYIDRHLLVLIGMRGAVWGRKHQSRSFRRSRVVGPLTCARECLRVLAGAIMLFVFD